MPACSVIVPFRATSNPSRLVNLQTVLQWLNALPVSVIVSEHSAFSQVDVADFPGLQHVWEQSDGAFSKSAACNAGVVLAHTPVVALVDADTLVRPQTLQACIKRIADPGESEPIQAIRPFGHLVDLGKDESQLVHETGKLPEEASEASDPTRLLEHIPLAGGIIVMEREAYLSVGGMDESFLGWGGEDDALSSALTRFGVKARVLTSEVGYHLWHDRDSEDRYQHVNYQANAERALWWRDCSDTDFHSTVAEGRSRLIDRQ